MSAEKEIDNFVAEWLETVKRTSEGRKNKDFKLVDTVHLSSNQAWNFVSRKGYQHLLRGAELLVSSEKLAQKVALNSAVKKITDAFFAHLPKARKRRVISEKAIADGARSRIRALPRDDGIYVFPVVFARRATRTNLKFGPLAIQSKRCFIRSHRVELKRHKYSDPRSSRPFYEDWKKHVELYDHFISVEVRDHEAEMAWPVARDAAEFFLNIIRMILRYSHADDIRIGGGFVWETRQSSLQFTPAGGALFTSKMGPWGTHLRNDWVGAFETQIGNHRSLLAGYLDWFLKGEESDNPIIERVRYASVLIAEAYSEPHDYVRLVRLVSALESLALIERTDKAHSLALACAYAGGWGDPVHGSDIYDAVKAAYRWRNAVVHGDAPSKSDVSGAFVRLEAHLLYIVVGFMHLFVTLSHRKLQSIRQLRREMRQRLCLFFWNAELGIDT